MDLGEARKEYFAFSNLCNAVWFIRTRGEQTKWRVSGGLSANFLLHISFLKHTISVNNVSTKGRSVSHVFSLQHRRPLYRWIPEENWKEELFKYLINPPRLSTVDCSCLYVYARTRMHVWVVLKCKYSWQSTVSCGLMWCDTSRGFDSFHRWTRFREKTNRTEILNLALFLARSERIQSQHSFEKSRWHSFVSRVRAHTHYGS